MDYLNWGDILPNMAKILNENRYLFWLFLANEWENHLSFSLIWFITFLFTYVYSFLFDQIKFSASKALHLLCLQILLYFLATKISAAHCLNIVNISLNS